MDKLLILEALTAIKNLTRLGSAADRDRIYEAFSVADYLAEYIRSEPKPDYMSSYHIYYQGRLKDYLKEIQTEAR